jgi:phenylacetate-coenzyme A ligase PaaK-like adenylate-forming protein
MHDRPTPPIWHFLSALQGAAWPAIGQPAANLALAMQYQFAQSEWFSAARLQELQFSQLAVLAAHAYASVPFYRERWRNCYDPALPLTPARLAALPLLRRTDLQDHFEALRSLQPPATHGAPHESRTSGSTGSPVRVLKTPICGLLWNAFALRDHLWQRRDLDAKLAGIR